MKWLCVCLLLLNLVFIGYRMGTEEGFLVSGEVREAAERLPVGAARLMLVRELPTPPLPRVAEGPALTPGPDMALATSGPEPATRLVAESDGAAAKGAKETKEKPRTKKEKAEEKAKAEKEREKAKAEKAREKEAREKEAKEKDARDKDKARETDRETAQRLAEAGVPEDLTDPSSHKAAKAAENEAGGAARAGERPEVIWLEGAPPTAGTKDAKAKDAKAKDAWAKDKGAGDQGEKAAAKGGTADQGNQTGGAKPGAATATGAGEAMATASSTTVPSVTPPNSATSPPKPGMAPSAGGPTVPVSSAGTPSAGTPSPAAPNVDFLGIPRGPIATPPSADKGGRPSAAVEFLGTPRPSTAPPTTATTTTTPAASPADRGADLALAAKGAPEKQDAQGPIPEAMRPGPVAPGTTPTASTLPLPPPPAPPARGIDDGAASPGPSPAKGAESQGPSHAPAAGPALALVIPSEKPPEMVGTESLEPPAPRSTTVDPISAAPALAALARPAPPLPTPPAPVPAAAGPAAAPTRADLRCLRIGPFASKEETYETRKWLLEHDGLTARLRSASVTAQRRYWVAIQEDGEERARLRIAELKAKGVKDIFWLERGEGKNTVSLGVFSTEEAAERHVKEIGAYGVKARVVPKERVQEVHSLLVSLPPGGAAPQIPAASLRDAKVTAGQCGTRAAGE
jgi:hypothetical protein